MEGNLLLRAVESTSCRSGRKTTDAPPRAKGWFVRPACLASGSPTRHAV